MSLSRRLAGTGALLLAAPLAPLAAQHTALDLWKAGTAAFGIFVPSERPANATDAAGKRLPPLYTAAGARALADQPLLDYLFLNLEGNYDAGAVKEMVAGLRASGAKRRLTLLVRIPTIEAAGEAATKARIREVHDLGADGVVVPHVRSATEAQHVMGFLQEARANVWSKANPGGTFVAMLMVEDRGAVAELDAIAAVPGYSLLSCGIGSLTQDMGGDRAGAEAACKRVRDAGAARGMPSMMTANGSTMADRLEKGYLGLLLSGTVEQVTPVIQAGRAQPAATIPAKYREIANRIIAAAEADSAGAWNRIAELTDTFGHRLSGSVALEQAIDWTVATMKADGLANVRKEPVMVPHWVRGAESLELVSPRRQTLPMLGLGGSIATPPKGITAEVMVVASFEELTQRAAEAKGKIVLYDAEWRDYGYNGAFRRQGAIAAAKAGAVASLARAAGPYSMRTPHTGNMSYDSTVTKIPHASVTAEDAMMMRRMIARGQKVVVTLTMSAKTLPDARSHNVMGELVGREKPNEVVVMGGHIDSWDVGQGAMDDAGGVVVAWEAIRLLKRLGLTPRRTIRVVGWTNEENGGRGGQAYRQAHQQEVHQLAIESDGGVFAPLGFGFTGPAESRKVVEAIGGLLAPIGAGRIGPSGGGADIGPIMQTGVPGMGLEVDGTRYFWFHHTEADTPDKLDPKEVQRCVAAMAVMAYVAADLEQSLR